MSFRLFGKGLACLIFYMIADAGIEMNNYSILEDCIRDTFSRVVWSHKIQEKQADIYQSQYTVLMVVNIFSSSLTSAGIVSLLWFDELYIKIISALLSFVTVSVSAYIKQFNLNAMVKSHKSTATKLLAARDELTCLLMKCRLQDMSIGELREQYESLVKKIDEIYADAPNTSNKAVKLAKEALQVTGDNTFTDEEINSYMPIALKKEHT